MSPGIMLFFFKYNSHISLMNVLEVCPFGPCVTIPMIVNSPVVVYHRTYKCTIVYDCNYFQLYVMDFHN